MSVVPVPISSMTLGTVQLGLPYGVHPGADPIAADLSHSILQEALDNGITTLDTARAYGISEEVIGAFLRKAPADAFPHIITKFSLPEALEAADTDAMRSAVRGSLEASLAALGRERVTALLFHQSPRQSMQSFAVPLGDILQELMDEGRIGVGGLSAFRPSEARSVIGHPAFRCVQLPMNLFDTTSVREGLLEALHSDGVSVFIRSIFLKGLFFMQPDHLTGNLTVAAPYLRQLSDFALAAGRSMEELAFVFVRDTPGVSSVIFGADALGQVTANARMRRLPGLDGFLRQQLQDAFSGVPGHIIVPYLWKP